MYVSDMKDVAREILSEDEKYLCLYRYGQRFDKSCNSLVALDKILTSNYFSNCSGRDDEVFFIKVSKISMMNANSCTKTNRNLHLVNLRKDSQHLLIPSSQGFVASGSSYFEHKEKTSYFASILDSVSFDS